MKADAGVDVEGVIQGKGLLPVGLGLVEQFDIRFLAPVEIRADSDIARGGQIVTGLPHVGIDAEDFLDDHDGGRCAGFRSEEHTSELQSLMRISYAVFCLKKKNTNIIEKHKLRNS